MYLEKLLTFYENIFNFSKKIKFRNNYSNIIVIISYLLKSSQALLIFYLIEYYIDSEQLNIAFDVYFILGLVLIFDFGVPNVIARNIIRQTKEKYDYVKIGFGFKILLGIILISIVVACLYSYNLGQTNLIPILIFLIIVRKSWSLNNAVLFGFDKVENFRINELILELFRFTTTIIFLMIFRSFSAVLIAEIISFLIILIKSFNENKNIKINFKNEDFNFFKIQLSEIWKGGLLFISSYLSFNLIYSADLSNLDLYTQNNFFFSLKMFFALKTISQLPITNLLPKIANAFNIKKFIPKSIVINTLILCFLIFIGGSFFYFILLFFEVDFILKYYDKSFTFFLLLICLGELLNGVLSNITIATGKIPFWISSLVIYLIQLTAINLINDLSISKILILMSIRPIILFIHSFIFANKLIK